MGWMYSHKEKGRKAVDFIRHEAFGDEDWQKRVVAATANWEAVFVVVKAHEPDSKVYVPDADGTIRALLVFAIKNAPRDWYNFGYKDMSETMGPYGLEAPLSIIEQCSPLRGMPADEPEFSSLRSATEYRARSKAKAAMKATKRTLKAGQTVKLPEALSFGGVKHQTFTVTMLRTRRGQRKPGPVFRASDGMLCRLTAAQLSGAEIA